MIDFRSFCDKVMSEQNYKLSGFHYDMMDSVFEGRLIKIIAPRGHLKTTIFSILYPLWRMYTGTDWQNKPLSEVRICGVSSALDQSWKMMEVLQDMVENVEFLKDLKPPKKHHWSRFGFTSINSHKYFVKPFNSTIRGTHVDFFICDDILRDDKLSQQQIKDLFWSTIFPCVQTRKGQIIVAGTPMTMDDLFTDLDVLPEWKGKRYQAVKLNEEGLWMEPLWKERFTLDELQNLREHMGKLLFDREYLCNPLAGGSSLFPSALIQRQLHSLELNAPREFHEYYMGIDVALTTGKTADWTVFTIIEEEQEKVHTSFRKIHRVVKIDRFQIDDLNAITNKIKEYEKLFNFKKILIDDKGLGKGLVKMCEQEDVLRYVIEPYQTTKERKIGILSHLEGGMTAGTLFILDNDVLLRELRGWGIKKDKFGKEVLEGMGRHDDTVISLALAYEAATTKKFSYSMEVFY